MSQVSIRSIDVTQKFKLRSTEQNNPTEYSCTFLSYIFDKTKPNKMLVRVEPSIPNYVYQTQKDIDRVVVAPRHAGVSIYPEVSEWPCYVHICVPKKNASWEDGPYDVLDWGMLQIK